MFIRFSEVTVFTLEEPAEVIVSATVFGFKLNGLKEEILGFSEFSFADFIVGREEEIISVSVGEDVGVARLSSR